MSFSKNGNNSPTFLIGKSGYLVSTEDAVDPENRERGIKTPGWVIFNEIERTSGGLKRIVETVISFSGKGTVGIEGTLPDWGPIDPDPPEPAYFLRTPSVGSSRTIHSGHSLVDSYIHTGPYPSDVRTARNSLFPEYPSHGGNEDVYFAKSTIPGSPLRWRWVNATEPFDAKEDISLFETLMTTEAGPPARLGYPGNGQGEKMRDTLEYLTRFVLHSVRNGDGGSGAEVVLWSIWPDINGWDTEEWRDQFPEWSELHGFRNCLPGYGDSFRFMADYATWKIHQLVPDLDPDYRVWLIPGHKWMERVYDDCHAGLFPGVTGAEFFPTFFSDDIHTNDFGGYGLLCLVLSSLYQINLNEVEDFYKPSDITEEQATYFKTLAWDIANTYSRVGMGGADSAENLYDFDTYGDPNSHIDFDSDDGGGPPDPIDPPDPEPGDPVLPSNAVFALHSGGVVGTSATANAFRSMTPTLANDVVVFGSSVVAPITVPDTYHMVVRFRYSAPITTQVLATVMTLTNSAQWGNRSVGFNFNGWVNRFTGSIINGDGSFGIEPSPQVTDATQTLTFEMVGDATGTKLSVNGGSWVTQTEGAIYITPISHMNLNLDTPEGNTLEIVSAAVFPGEVTGDARTGMLAWMGAPSGGSWT